jgi:hypothetical protein
MLGGIRCKLVHEKSELLGEVASYHEGDAVDAHAWGKHGQLSINKITQWNAAGGSDNNKILCTCERM